VLIGIPLGAYAIRRMDAENFPPHLHELRRVGGRLGLSRQR